jgi:DHA1 family multidrug resistance protein-like MFS transporter
LKLNYRQNLVEDNIQMPPPGIENENYRARRKSLWSDKHIASLIVAVGISYLGFGLVSPLRTLYARSEGASGGEVGLMGAAYLFSGFIFLFPFGWLSDRMNRVNLIVGGLLAHMVITILYSMTTSGELFIALRFAEGISTAAVMPAARATLADLVPRGRNGEAFGLMGAALMFGMLGGPPVGTFLAEAFGYMAAYWLAAAMFLPAVALVLYAFRNYHQASLQQANLKQASLNAAKLDGLRTEPEGGPIEVPDTRPESLWTVPLVMGCLFRVALGIGPGLAITVWSIYMADLGFSLVLIGWTYTVYAVPMLLVSPSAGRFSDRYGRLLMMFAGGLFLGVLWVLYGLVTAFVAFIILGIVEGSLDAIARTANDGYLADHSPAGKRGKAQAIFNAATQFGSLFGAVASGFLYEVNKTLPFIVLGIFQFVLTALCLVVLALYQRRTAQNRAIPVKSISSI